MNRKLSEILKELELFSEKPKKEQEHLKSELERIACANPEDFENTIKRIVPSNDSVLFEIYESLSINPDRWNDFILSEFRRIRRLAEESVENQELITEPLLALSFFARKQFKGLDKLIHECSLSLKSSSTAVVKMSMDLLMDSYFIDAEKYKYCKILVEKQVNSANKDIKEFAQALLKDKRVNPLSKRIESLYKKYSVFFWCAVLILTIGYYDDFKTALIVTGMALSGFSLAYLILQMILIILKRNGLKSLYRSLAFFIVLTILLYFSVENKRSIIFILPFCVSVLIPGLFALRK